MTGTPAQFYNVTNTVINARLSPGILAGGSITSKSTTDGYLVFFDKPAAQVTLGTTQPIHVVSCFGLSTAPLIRDSEIVFWNAISLAFVDDVPLGAAARVGNVNLVIR